MFFLWFLDYIAHNQPNKRNDSSWTCSKCTLNVKYLKKNKEHKQLKHKVLSWAEIRKASYKCSINDM